MKKGLLLIALVVLWTTMHAQLPISLISLSDSKLEVDENSAFILTMTLTLDKEYHVGSNQMSQLTPYIESPDGIKSAFYPTIIINGRKREIMEKRAKGKSRQKEWHYRRVNGENQSVHYNATIKYEPWMSGASVKLLVEETACSECTKIEEMIICSRWQPTYAPFKPVISFIQPQEGGIKMRAEAGKAYLDFPVNETTIYPDFRNNPLELDKIHRTIAKIHEHKNTTISSILITGNASPEGSYSNNSRLSKGRAEELRDIILKSYAISPEIVRVYSVAEDWEGLATQIKESHLIEKEQLLAIINAEGVEFDTKERQLKLLESGNLYKRLKDEFFPKLRRTDYMINYVVSSFTIEEAKEMLINEPQLLSLEELFLIAQSYERGTEPFYETMQAGVELFPEDQIANLNASGVALSRKELNKASYYLSKSDQEQGATLNNWGVLRLLEGKLDEAESYFAAAEAKGVVDATANKKIVIEKRKELKRYNNIQLTN